jgi:multiple sugar transport system permease protein
LLPLILPRFFDAFYIFLVRQFFMGIPNEIIEAAKIDGCSHVHIFRSIALPLIKPAIITVVIFEVNARWQDFFSPLVFLRSQKLYTMALGLRAYTTLYGTEWDLLLAASVMFTLPMIIIFLISQKQFIEGISMAGLKL